jgi:hypothetical protein
MNPSTLSKITAAAAFLCSADAQKTEKYLDGPYRLSLQLLFALSDGEGRTAQEIADLVPPECRNRNVAPTWTTVNKILLALKKGGVEFVIGEGDPRSRIWKLPGGRPTIGITKKSEVKK